MTGLKNASDPVLRATIVIGGAGLCCLLISVYIILVGDHTTAVPFAVLGIGAIVTAAFARQIASVRLGPSGVELTLVGFVATPDAQRFADAIVGSWWEVIGARRDRSVVSLCTISVDETKSLRLNGRGYYLDGLESARWRSEMVRLYPDEQKLIYLWTGEFTGKDANRHFHGLATLNFELADPSSKKSIEAGGPFWHVDEATPSATTFNDVRLHRILDQTEIDKMQTGSQEAKADVIANVLERWPAPSSERIAR